MRRSVRRLWWALRWVLPFYALLAVWLALPSIAYASTATPAPTLIFPWQQVWPLVIGAIVPLFTYVLNRVGPWVSEPVKAFVLVAVSALATALYTALATNVIGFNDSTLQLILTGIAGAFAAHHWLWKPSGVAYLLREPQRRAPVVDPPAPAPAPRAVP